MSNKLALATIQFKADAKGANAALESLRKESKDAHDEVDRLQKAFDNGIKTMMDANGIEFDVAKRLKEAKTAAKNFDDSIAQLIKGATALEAVVKNIRLGEIEKNTRGELVGAMNAINARRRNLGEEKTPDYAERKKDLDDMEAEIKKQINRIDHDTERVLQTLREGGTVSQEVIDKEIKGLNELLRLIPETDEEWKKYNAQLTEIEGHVAKMNEAQLKQTASILGDKNLGQYNENQIRDAIAATKELMKTVETGGDVYNQYAQNIVNAEKHLDQYGVAAERARQKEAAATEKQKQKEQELSDTMNKRMRSLTTLSADALSETRKYWEAQRNGAEKGTDAFNKAEEALKRITNQERKRKAESLDKILGDPSKFGITEVKAAVQEMERLRDSVQKGIPAWQHYNKMVNEGKAYIDNLAKSEAAQRIEAQMRNITTLSATGLTEVKKYWETMVAGAARGSAELTTYKAKLEEVTAEEQARMKADAQQRVGIISSGNLGQYSEAEIRKAIEAANQLIKTYQTASPEAQALAQNIVNAENHLKQYGVEAERAAQKEAKAVEDAAKKRREMDELMVAQRERGGMSESALKAQQQYWQRLIDDPKTAAESLRAYEFNLREVQRLQEQMVAQKGESALAFFRGDTSNASAAQIQENAKALKTYRDSLPQQSQADVINEINGYLQQAGVSAEKAAEKTMSLTNALKLAGTAGTSGFRGTAEDLQLAQKAIEQAISTTDKGTAKYDRLQQALARIKAEMAGTGISSQKMQKILANPKGEKSVDNLKNAVARARAEMEVTAQRAERLQRLIEAIGNGKNKDAHKDLLKNLQQSLKDTEKEYDNLAKSTQKAEGAQRALEGQSKNTASAFERAWSRLKTYVGVYVSAAVAMQKVISTFSKVNELSDKMGEVGKTTGLTNEQLAHLQESLSRISTRTAMNELMSLSAAAGQLGLKTEQDVMAFTRAANMITVALPEMGREGVTELMKIAQATGTVEDLRRQIQAGLIDDNNAVASALTRVGSTIDALRANSASTAPRITDFVKRVGAVGAQSKISMDQIAALGSTVDALGMRTEMAATALARMIPAIKNNAFAISQAINIAPDEIVRMYEAGDAMQVIVKLLRAMNGKGEDEIEGMLNERGFGEILKALNQQGARAGQVFAGLAQNVNELERQLDIAHDAFQENIAIQNEYNRMNETTAGKLAQLGNTLTNLFANATSSKLLGYVYDFLNWFFKNWINNPKFYTFFNTLIGYLVVIKTNLAAVGWGALVASWKALGAAWEQSILTLKNLRGGMMDVKKGLGEMDKAARKVNTANAYLAIAAAIFMIVKGIKDWIAEMHKVETIANEEFGRIAREVSIATDNVDKFFESLGNAKVALEDANKKVADAEKAQKDAQAALDGSRKSTEKLEEANRDLKIAQEGATIANDAHLASIRKINEQYSPYLGYMLSEISTAAELANARDLINAKLQETITLKQKETAYGRLESEFGGGIEEQQTGLSSVINENFRDDVTKAAKVNKEINKAIRDNIGDFVGLRDAVKNILTEAGVTEDTKKRGTDYDYLKIVNSIEQAAEKVRMAEKKMKDARDTVDRRFESYLYESRKDSQKELKEQLKAISDGDKTIENGYENSLKNLEEEYKKADEKNRKQRAAALLQQMDAYETLLKKSPTYFDLEDKKEEAAYYELREKGEKRIEELRKQREKLAKEAGDAYTPIQSGENSVTSTEVKTKVWGDNPKAESPYTEWNADDLVKRRKSMNTFVRALQEDTDIQTVLKQDAAFQQAYAKGLIKNTRDAIEWYNEERLKIQDELHSRHLNNTGDWLDPKKQRGRKKVVNDDMKAYLEELDAYYTERKAKIQEARNDEEISEAEAWNRTLSNETEWRQRRAELQQLYANKAAKVAEEEQQAIFDIIADRTEDSAEFIQKSIGKTVKFIQKIGEKSQAEMKRILGDLDLGIEKDLLRQRNAIGQHLKAIEDIINKENPYNGIVKGLQDNLGKMDILFADIEDKSQRTVEREMERTMFIMEQATKGYGLTWEEMMREMAKNGWKAWAEAIQNDPAMQTGLMHQVTKVFEQIQDAIRKEANELKRQAEIMWSNILLPGGDGKTTVKDVFEQTIGALGIGEGRVSRANSLIGAGQASERVADKLAIQQMKVQLAMQQYQYNLTKKIAKDKIDGLRKEAQLQENLGNMEKARALRMQADNAAQALNLAIRKEQTEELKQQEAIIAKTEESQNRLYRELQEWGSLVSSSLQSLFEASNAGNEEYYNEMAKLRLTGQGQGGTYIITENAGTSDAEAHYETLSDEEYLQRVREIEQQNASAEAWKKVMDDFSQKLNDTITDQINAMLQNASLDANTAALGNVKIGLEQESMNLSQEQFELLNNTNALTTNTEAVVALTEKLSGEGDPLSLGGQGGTNSGTEGNGEGEVPEMLNGQQEGNPSWLKDWGAEQGAPDAGGEFFDPLMKQLGLREEMAEQLLALQDKVVKSQKKGDKEMTSSTQSAFAKMTAAANLYGVAYQAMSNDNLSASQKFGMIAIQAAGQAAITSLTVGLTESTAETAKDQPVVLSKLWKQLGWAAIPVYALFTGLLGGLLGLAASKVGKAKSEISSITGASGASAGRLSTGMLTYAEGNVNEFTDPGSLTPGKSYNVDAADGKTYRAKYMGKGAKTHITNGPEFHLAGEAGREMIIDAGTTRQITMNEREIFHAIQTLSGGGRLRHSAMRRGRGIGAFADGNLDDFEEVMDGGQMTDGGYGFGSEQMAAFQSSLDKNNELLERALTEGIKGVFDVFGERGLIDSYDTGKKIANRHGQKY